jgi:valyl-tRNA synthetase
MKGFNTMWMPGTDHAGIATQNVVERELKKEGKTRQQMGREKFVARVWEWKKQYGDRIVFQAKRMGDSADWDRLAFTLDEGVSQAVRRVFVSLYKDGLIYKGTRLVNWCPRCETAVSDLEVDHKEIKSKLFHIKYPLGTKGEHVVVATTRPETMLGDTAVAVHPDDERYKAHQGGKVKLPLTKREIPIVADTMVDKAFGSGVVKITPAHDFNDYEVSKRHPIEVLNILTTSGHLNDKAGKYKGLSTIEARKKVLEDLREQELLLKEEDHTHSVGHCERCSTVIEPFLSEQWFVNIKPLAGPAQRVVESGTVTFEPESWTKVYLHWMSNIQDWCISRQLWWGHRIPAWHCKKCEHVTVAEIDPTVCEKCGNGELTQEEDVLDTWFSSGLWPFSTQGWPQETELLKTFYPTNVLVTGPDIIFFWVARMIMMGLHFAKDVPFRTVYIHGIVRDSQGRKMSKSLNNSVDPIDIIEKYGTDALRFMLLSQVSNSRDIKFRDDRMESARNFMNKIWNATRFSLAAMKDFKPPADLAPKKADLSLPDKWIIFRTSEVETQVDEFLSENRFAETANLLHSFIWNDVCDWYLEFIKPVIYGNATPEREATQLVLGQTLNRAMRLLHPLCPFITEAIYQKLPIKNEACIIDQYPDPRNDRAWLSFGSAEAAFELEIVKEVIAAVRNIRGENRISPAVEIDVKIDPHDERVQKILGSNRASIIRMAKVKDLFIGEVTSMQKCAVSPVIVKDARIAVIVPLEGIVDIQEEINRLAKNIEKTQKELTAIEVKLANENFIKNAPEDVVILDKQRVADLRSKITNMTESQARLK